jgi:hypothetical protein
VLATRSTALAANPTPPFTQCPPVAVDTSCAILIVIEPDGSLVILHDSTQKPLDKSEDTLVGVQNNSTITAPSIAIGSASQPVFGFEGDGLCTYVFVGNAYCQSAPKPPTGYEGPYTSIGNISGDKKRGTVTFTEPDGGLAAGDGTYFSLEGAITPTSLITGAATSLVFTATSATSSDFADSATAAATLTSAGVAVPNAPLTSRSRPGRDRSAASGRPICRAWPPARSPRRSRPVHIRSRPRTSAAASHSLPRSTPPHPSR